VFCFAGWHKAGLAGWHKAGLAGRHKRKPMHDMLVAGSVQASKQTHVRYVGSVSNQTNSRTTFSLLTCKQVSELMHDM
jgi:hypothetical protein